MAEGETKGPLTPTQDVIAGSILFLYGLNSLPPHLEHRLARLGHPRALDNEKVAQEIAHPPTDGEVLPTRTQLLEQLKRALEHPRLTLVSPREAREILEREDNWATFLGGFLDKARDTDKALKDPERRGPAWESANRSTVRRLDWQTSVMVPLVQLVEPGLHRD